MPPPEPLSENHQPSPDHSPAEQATEEEFQFLRCQGCQAEANNPKLLHCLHTLCSGCLEARGMQCPICQAPQPQDAEEQALDNVFFESLQRRLSVHRQILRAQAECTRCKTAADFCCFECEQLLCAKCFEAHQWFLKHEARPLAEVRSQSVSEFLDGTRKSNNIFCSNRNHRSPTLTSIYCRGCSKPLCCTCALLDGEHSHLKCDISTEIQQRQDELDAMTRALQEQDSALAATQAQMRSAATELERRRTDLEARIRADVRQLVQHVQAQERELLEAVSARYQREYAEIRGQLGALETVLQRIRTGSVLVQRMKRYASEQEVLDMHGFLRQALGRLRQAQPQPHNLQAAVPTDGFTDCFDEFKARLQNLVSCITRGTDAASPKEASQEATYILREPVDVELPEGAPTAPAQALGLAEARPVAVVQSVPGAHPVPLYAYSIRDPSCTEVPSAATSQKRKSCQTECPKKFIKIETEEEKEARVECNSSEQPRPSTSQVISPLPLEGKPSPKRDNVENEESPLNSNSETDNAGKAEERVVVISSSEDSDAENSSFRELDDSSSESSDIQLECSNSIRVLDESLTHFQPEDRPLVFFDLKIDDETQKIRQLAAVNQESKFRVLIQPEAFSVSSKAVSLEVGLQHFLLFLSSMRRPILACYRLWGPSLPHFFRALEDMNRLWEFREAVSGFLATLPLIQERVPQSRSLKLKNLAKFYLARNMNEHSALATVLAMRDLCRILEVSASPQLAPHLYSFSSLQCYVSLQPLVQAAVLPWMEARLLALHNVSFVELLTAHRQDPQRGLKKYGQYLQATSSPPAQPAFNLQALSTYFKGLLEGLDSAQAEDMSAPLASHSLAKRVSQQS